MHYVGKAVTAFNLRLNNHREGAKKPNSILACKHFQEQGHSFNKHPKFIIIDKLINLHGSKEALLEMLVIRENFWIQKLKTLVPFGLNQELSKRTFMLLPFRLISASLKQLSRDITNDIIVKQNLFDVMQFLSSSEFRKISMKKATAETS